MFDWLSTWFKCSKLCKDIDECLGGKHYCGDITKCINTNGSYTCDCETICIDNDSCNDRHLAAKLATMLNDHGVGCHVPVL